MDAKTRKAALDAKNPAEFARTIGIDPKRFRSVLRNRFKIKVSAGDAFDSKVKQQCLDFYEAKDKGDTAEGDTKKGSSKGSSRKGGKGKVKANA